MNQVEGTVVTLDSDGEHALIDVDADICPRCAKGKGCGAGIFGSSGRSRRILANLPANVRVAVGDNVFLTISSRNILAAAAIVYGWPLAAASLAVLFVYVWRPGDVAAVVAALFGLSVGTLLARRRLRQQACLKRFVPTVTSVPGSSAFRV